MAAQHGARDAGVAHDRRDVVGEVLDRDARAIDRRRRSPVPAVVRVDDRATR
jgi:hypothetical protein